MQERPDERVAGGGVEGTASEQEGVSALAEGEIRSERAEEEDDDRPTAPGLTEPSGPLPDQPGPPGR
jgi:hypothetical protein